MDIDKQTIITIITTVAAVLGLGVGGLQTVSKENAKDGSQEFIAKILQRASDNRAKAYVDGLSQGSRICELMRGGDTAAMEEEVLLPPIESDEPLYRGYEDLVIEQQVFDIPSNIRPDIEKGAKEMR